ncbi:metallophosphoesterase [Methylotuvimicrobium sp. KM2]|uniref:metallophosphoesterase family protein n=1 Tax=Methylotuvimicrobium sp. KM2 TaxID=3133976 RepID=UPI0031016746
MHFSILHISDLHRDLDDEIGNEWLLDSLENDFNQFSEQTPQIMKPSLCIVSGDLVHGVGLGVEDADNELKRQYSLTETFLIGLADRFFNGERERVVILPGNHDVCFNDVIQSVEKIEIPEEPEKKVPLVKELFKPNSKLRWSWRDLCFYRILDEDIYQNRFRYFISTYNSFYQGKRLYQLAPEQQFDVFDFADLGFSIVTLNSCFNNDPLRRAGAFHNDALAKACRALRDNTRAGWLSSVAWHHNLVGKPEQDDYLDAGSLQHFIEAGASLAFHGHQHLSECFDERYQLGKKPRKITIVSAGTLCAEPSGLRPGIPRSYNIVELNTDSWKGVLHQRQMVNADMPLPVWGEGYFINTGSSFFEFDICKPIATRPKQLDEHLILFQADNLLGEQKWHEALDILEKIRNVPLARSLIAKALEEINDPQLIIEKLYPPINNAEAVMIGGVILTDGTSEQAKAFVELEFVLTNQDASVCEISRRITERRLK